jgi:hypothetical protein
LFGIGYLWGACGIYGLGQGLLLSV